MNTSIDWLMQMITNQFWVVQSFLIVLGALLLSYAENKIFNHFHPKLSKTKHAWDDTFIDAIHPPVRMGIWILGIFIAAQAIMQGTHEAFLSPFIEPLKSLSLTFLFVWFMIRFISNIEGRVIGKAGSSKKKIDKTTVRAISQLFRIAVLVTAVLICMQVFGIPISGVLAFGGIGGIGIALAAKDLLANFFGGLMIFLDRPFAVGDWISSPDKQIEGTVEHIGWRLTRIRTFDKRPRYVPNGVFSGIIVDNPSRMTNRRIKATIGLRYDDAFKVGEVVSDIKAMLHEHEAIDTTKTLLVNFIEFSASSLDLQIYTFTKTTDWAEFQDIRQDVFLRVIDIIKKHGADCAFPTRTLHIPK